MAEHELDLFLVSSRDSIYYLTGIVCEPLERPMSLLVRCPGPRNGNQRGTGNLPPKGRRLSALGHGSGDR
ncbi:MAG: aminopeptidase P family N-terminal domain-containing protein [Candidatus Nealsonbacteria bacterium]|nr:aminopeptidase P family N-terminal domain-containing protein [Candidatus Nealsonbacteria bacterium]